jgi:Flp pilus assembly protein TadG
VMERQPRGVQRPPGAGVRAQEGQALVLTALFLVVLVGLVGLALDVGHQMDRYREAQNTADAAALAGADVVYLSSDQSVTTTVQLAQTDAAEVVQANGLSSQTMQLTFLDSNKQVITNTSSLSDPGQIDYVAASVQDTFTPYFIQVLGINRSSVSTYAMAKVQWVPLCELCVLDPTANGALTLSGGGGFTGTNIRAIVNSDAGQAGTTGTALIATGGGTFSDSGPDAAIDMVGTSNTSGGGTISPVPVSGVQPVPDPLSWVPMPTGIPVGSCVSSKNNSCDGTPPSVKVTSGITQTINPGVYTQITVNQGTLVLNPGIYVITGPFSAGSGASIIGNGVMLYLTCASDGSPYYEACPSGGLSTQTTGSLTLSGQVTLTLSGPTAAQATYCSPTPSTSYCSTNAAYVPWQYTGLLIFQDRNDNSSMTLTGSSSVSPPSSCTSVTTNASCIAGTIYAKDAQISIAGGGSAQTALQSDVIGDTVTFTGNGGNGEQTFAMSFPAGVNAPLAPLNGLVQ